MTAALQKPFQGLAISSSPTTGKAFDEFAHQEKAENPSTVSVSTTSKAIFDEFAHQEKAEKRLAVSASTISQEAFDGFAHQEKAQNPSTVSASTISKAVFDGFVYQEETDHEVALKSLKTIEDLFLEETSCFLDEKILRSAFGEHQQLRNSFSERNRVVDGSLLKRLAPHLSNLKKLHVPKKESSVYVNIDDATLEALARNCHKLQVLRLPYDTSHKLYEEADSGFTCFSNKAIIALAEGCHGLKELYLPFTEIIEDNTLIALAEHCPHLKQVYFLNAEGVTDRGVIALANGCPNLEILHLPKCHGLTDASLKALMKCTSLCDVDIGESPEISQQDHSFFLQFHPYSTTSNSLKLSLRIRRPEARKNTFLYKSLVNNLQDPCLIFSLRPPKNHYSGPPKSFMDSFFKLDMEKTTHIDLSGREYSNSDVATVLRRAASPRYLGLRGCKYLHNDCFADVTDPGVLQLSSLHYLDLDGTPYLGHDALSTASYKFPNLKGISLANTGYELSGHKGGITDNTLAHLRNCKDLEFLDLSLNKNITSAGIRGLLLKLPKLRFLRLSYVLDHSTSHYPIDNAVIDALRNCPELQFLDLSHAESKFTEETIVSFAATHPKLQYVVLDGNKVITDTSAQAFIKNCPDLRGLSLEVTSVSDDFLFVSEKRRKDFQYLNLNGCDITDEGLKALAQGSPSLERLSLEGCEDITDAGIEAIIDSCSLLEMLRLRDNWRLTGELYKRLDSFRSRLRPQHY